MVWEHDKPVMRTDGSLLPTLELKGRVDETLWNRYRQLFTSPEYIPCASVLPTISNAVFVSMQERVVTERLKKKPGNLFRCCRIAVTIGTRPCTGYWEKISVSR